MVWGLNSVGECYLHTVEVTGSNPVVPTIFLPSPNTAACPTFSSFPRDRTASSLSIERRRTAQLIVTTEFRSKIELRHCPVPWSDL